MLDVRQWNQVLGTKLRRYSELTVGRKRDVEDARDVMKLFALDSSLPIGIDDRDFRLRRSSVRA